MALSVGAFAFIIGVIAGAPSSAGISASLRRELAKLGSGSIMTPSGYIGFVFIFFVLAVSLFACAQIGAARRGADERLETLLSLPVGRRGWLGGRLLLARRGRRDRAGGGRARLGGRRVRRRPHLPPGMLEAGANCLPVALLFLGLAALVYAVVPRASAGITYGLVTVAFVWQLFGTLLGDPSGSWK